MSPKSGQDFTYLQINNLGSLLISGEKEWSPAWGLAGQLSDELILLICLLSSRSHKSLEWARQENCSHKIPPQCSGFQSLRPALSLSLVRTAALSPSGAASWPSSHRVPPRRWQKHVCKELDMTVWAHTSGGGMRKPSTHVPQTSEERIQLCPSVFLRTLQLWSSVPRPDKSTHLTLQLVASSASL